MAEVTRWTVLDKDGTVTNTILWDGEAEFAVPEGQKIVPEVTKLPRSARANEEEDDR